ncbi:MAG: adenosylcobinamide-GDP ribazoletransferase [Halolamina sp.]
MVLSPLRGAVGFLTRVPVGGDAADWRAFTDAPWAFPVVGAGVGLVFGVVLVLLQSLDFGVAAGAVFLAALVALLGITHFDGVADLGDAAVVHGDAETRVGVLKDSDAGVGAVVALVLAMGGIASGAVAVLALPAAGVVAVVVAAELGAKATMAGVACLGEARHEGLGSQFTDWNGRRELGAVALVVLVITLAVLVIAPAATAVTVGALAGGLLAGTLVARWANSLLDGVNGDVFGAVDVASRIAGLYGGFVTFRLLGWLVDGPAIALLEVTG